MESSYIDMIFAFFKLQTHGPYIRTNEANLNNTIILPFPIRIYFGPNSIKIKSGKKA